MKKIKLKENAALVKLGKEASRGDRLKVYIPESKPAKEKIICAAIWYKDLPTQTFRATNLDKGLLVCGHRHGHCIDVVKNLSGLRSVQFAPDGVGETEQGFLTDTNRFVDRYEAAIIAFNAGQIKEKIGKLFSEDLY